MARLSPLVSVATTKPGELAPDILVLHLIATGIMRCSEEVAKGKLLDADYPIPLQQGLDRLNIIRYRHGFPLVKSIPDLLAWCQLPLKDWVLDYSAGSLDPEDRLLIEQFPTEVCQDLACAVSDVEAELNERHFMDRVFTICKDAKNPQAYTDFRRLLIERPVMTALELLQCRDSYPSLEILWELLDAAYEEAPLDYMLRGTFSCCPICGNLRQPDIHRSQFLCEDERCRQDASSRRLASKGRTLQARDRIYWLRRDLRRFVMMPGRAELRLERRLLALKVPGLKIEMWPGFDRYDLHIELPTQKNFAVDVKDWAKPYLLAQSVKGIPCPPDCEAYYVFPQERKRAQPDYVRAFTNTCNSLGKITIGGQLKAAFENDFLNVVRKELGAASYEN